MEVTRLMRISKRSHSQFVKGICRKLAKFLGCLVGKNVQMGNNVQFIHNALGTVIYTNTILEDDVKIYQNVTLGKADVASGNSNAKFVIKKGAILCAGAKLLCRTNEILTVGENSIIAANAVLLNSVPSNEVWGGIPAHKLGDRRGA